MAGMLLIFYFIFFANCEYFTKDEIDIILSITENQFIKNIVISAKNPENSPNYCLQKLTGKKLFLTILDFSYIQIYLKYVPRPFYKSAMIIKEDVSGIYWAAHEGKISSYTWIVFDDQKGTNSKSLRSAYIPYNALFLLITKIDDSFYDITEIYNTDYWKETDDSDFVSKIQIRNHFGTWTRAEGLFLNILGFYDRRLDLSNTTFQITSITVIEDPFFATFMSETWRDIQRVMKFKSTWIKELYAIEYSLYVDADLSLATLTPSNYDPELVLVGPIFANRLYMHIKDNFNDDYDWASIFKPFSSQMWICLTIWLIISGTFLVFLEKADKDYFGAFLAPFDVLCGQWVLNDRETFGRRVVIFSILLSGLIFLNAYTAIFTSFLTIPTPRLPFEDFEGFIKDGTYLIGSVSSMLDDYIKDVIANLTDKSAEKFMFFSKHEKHSIESGINKLCSDQKTIFIMMNNVGFIAEQFFGLCKIYKIPKPILKQYMFFALRDYSPYKEIFNMFYMTQRSNGVIKKHERRMDNMEEIMVDLVGTGLNDSQEENFETNISQLDTVIKIIIFGWAISLIIFILELICRSILKKLKEK